jgi:hypothetical protein
MLSKLGSRAKKPRGNDIEWSNLGGNQTTHFVGYVESFNAKNSYYNCKKIGTTSYVRPTLCISLANKRKTQIE